MRALLDGYRSALESFCDQVLKQINPQDLCCSEAPQRAGSYWGNIFKTVKWVGGPGLRAAGLFFSVTRAPTGAGRPVLFGWAGLPGPCRGNSLRTQLDPLDLAPRGCKESLLP